MTKIIDQQGQTVENQTNIGVTINVQVAPDRYLQVSNTPHGSQVDPTSRPLIERTTTNPRPPRKINNFADREQERQRLQNVLCPQGGAMLHGSAGCGISALLRETANLPTQQLLDGVIYVDCLQQGLSSFDDLIQWLFGCFYMSTSLIRIPKATQQTYMQSLQALIIIDHISLRRSQITSLQDMLASSAVCVAADGAAPDTMMTVPIGGLPRQDAVTLCDEKARLDKSIPALRGLLERLCSTLHDLPLPLVLMAGFIQNDPDRLMQAVAALEALPAENDPLTRAVHVVLDMLTDDERRIIRALVTADGSSKNVPELAAISAQSDFETRDTLERLQAVGLVEEVESDTTPTGGKLERFALPCSASIQRVLQRIFPLDQEHRRAVAYFVSILPAHRHDLNWIEQELGNLLSAARTALETGQMDQVGLLAQAMQPLLVLRGRWDGWKQVIQWARQAADATQDDALLAWAWHERGTRAGLMGNNTQARKAIQKAIALRRKLGDQAGVAISQHNLSVLCPPVPPVSGLWQRRGATLFVLLGVLLLGQWGFRAFLIAPIPMQTATPTPSLTVTSTPMPSATMTSTLTPSPTPSPTTTNTPAPSLTPTGTATNTAIPTRTATSTPAPTATATLTATPRPTLTPVPPIDERGEEQVVALINERRQQNGCNVQLVIAEELTSAARRHSYDMAANNFLGHTGSDGSRPDQRIEEAGYLWAWGIPGTPGWAENASSDRTPEESVQSWMDSTEGHREAMLNCGFREVGVGYARSASGSHYWTAVFTVGRR